MALIGFFEIFLAIVCFFLIRYLKSNNNGLPRNLPIVGMLPQLLLNVHRVHDFCTEVLERSQCTFLLKGPWFANMDILLTVDPANVRYIMSTNFSNFPKGPKFKEIFDILGDGIFNADSDSWKTQRKVALALITNNRFYRFLVKTSQAKMEEGLIPVLDHVSKQGITVDLQNLFDRFSFDSTCVLVTGNDPGCLSIEFPENAFAKAVEDVEESIFYRHIVPESIWKLQRWLGIGEELKIKKAMVTVDNTVFGFIEKKREEMRKGDIMSDAEGVDLLTSYMNEDKVTELKFDDKFLRDTILTFIIAGRDSISSALTWFFWLVLKHPQAETKIREELNSIKPSGKMGKCWFFDTQQLNKLVYLHGALCEALRLYPPIPFNHKSALVKDILPSGHRVVPETKILFALSAMGRMKSIWGEDCSEFKPERWITNNGEIKHEPSYKFLTFNTGARACIGKDVAFIQLKAVAATIIHNYDVRVVEGQSFSPNVSTILRLKHGLMVRIHNRWV